MVKDLLQIDVIMFIQTKWISDNVGNLHPGINEDNLHNLKQQHEDIDEDDYLTYLEQRYGEDNNGWATMNV